MSYFQDARVEHEGELIEFSAAEGEALEGGSRYWHGPGSPSSYLNVLVFEAVRRKAPAVPQPVLLTLAAAALGTNVEALVGSIRWHESYMQWHDGDYEYRVLDPDEPDIVS
jgi:hypothetical protein